MFLFILKRKKYIKKYNLNFKNKTKKNIKINNIAIRRDDAFCYLKNHRLTYHNLYYPNSNALYWGKILAD